MKIKIISQQDLDKISQKKKLLTALMEAGYTKEEALAYMSWSATSHPITTKNRGNK